jgi:hypothetical protein
MCTSIHIEKKSDKKKMSEDDYAWEEDEEYVKESLPDETRYIRTLTLSYVYIYIYIYLYLFVYMSKRAY